MREILFRGKRISNGEWVEGGISQQSHINFDDGKAYCICTNNKDYFVEQYTIGQYTGLTDKNGRRFEGDVFQASDGDYIQRYIIAWNEDSLEWSAECVGNPEGTLPLSEFKVGEIEVIGNIFDNPGLIGE